MLTLSPRLVAVLAVPWVWASWSDPSPSGAALRVKNGFEFVFLSVGFVSFHVRLHCEAELLVYKILYISVQMVKSITAREIFARVPKVKKQLWGGEFWSKGYFMATVGQHGSERVIGEYVKQQGGGEYRRFDVGIEVVVQDSLFSGVS